MKLLIRLKIFLNSSGYISILHILVNTLQFYQPCFINPFFKSNTYSCNLNSFSCIKKINNSIFCNRTDLIARQLPEYGYGRDGLRRQ